MAVQVFKDGKSVLIDPSALQRHLASGWSVDDPNATPAKPSQAIVPAHLAHLPEPEAEEALAVQMGLPPTVQELQAGAGQATGPVGQKDTPKAVKKKRAHKKK